MNLWKIELLRADKTENSNLVFALNYPAINLLLNLANLLRNRLYNILLLERNRLLSYRKATPWQGVGRNLHSKLSCQHL